MNVHADLSGDLFSYIKSLHQHSQTIGLLKRSITRCRFSMGAISAMLVVDIHRCRESRAGRPHATRQRLSPEIIMNRPPTPTA
jgi:hypothetical protein